MWQRHIEIILDPNHIPQKGKITQHFRPPQSKSQQPRKRKEQQKTTPNKKKKKRIQNIPITYVNIFQQTYHCH